MIVNVLFFAAAREIAGASRIEVNVDSSATIGDLKSVLLGRIPELENLLQKSNFSLNEEYVTDATPLVDGAEVAVIPPVSGG